MPSLALRIRQLHKPVLIKAQGAVLAGAMLLVCNATHVLAADHVTFSLPEIKRGLFPFMVMAGLTRVLPRRAAIDFAMRGYCIDAIKAEQWGLINQVVPAAELDQAVEELAREIASLSPSAVRLGLAACDHQESLPFEQALPYLGEMLQKTLATEDAREGITAFLEKREPHWTGR
jgi:enoyl-CoA hydratase/carnithine racemase